MAVNPNLTDAMERVARVKAAREAKEAEKKAWWEKYYEQLSKMTPHQGGAHSRKERVFRPW